MIGTTQYSERKLDRDRAIALSSLDEDSMRGDYSPPPTQRLARPITLSDLDVDHIGPIEDYATSSVVDDVPVLWLLPTIDRFDELLRLDPGWDSFGAAPIAFEAVSVALQVLSIAAAPQAPPPTIVPASHGGIQLEWHMGGMDIEVEIVPEEAIELYVGDLESGEEYECSLDRDISPLAVALGVLTRKLA